MASIAKTIGFAAAVCAVLCPAWAAEVSEVPNLAPAASLSGLSLSYSITMPAMGGLPALPSAAVPAQQPRAAAPAAASPAARVAAVADAASKLAAPIAQSASGGASMSDEALSRAGSDLAAMRASGGADAVAAAPAAEPTLEDQVAAEQPLVKRYFEQVSRKIVGQKEAVTLAFVSLMTRKGHMLLEGDPGLGKTELAKAVAEVSGLGSHRIQFKPDMLPSDIVGYEKEDKDGKVSIKKGPIFKAPLILADEVNRGVPKTKAALLEPMAEETVSIGDTTFPLPKTFTVWGTMNPIDTEGVYPMLEPEKDRFLVSIVMTRPTKAQEKQITDERSVDDDVRVEQVFDEAKILELRKLIQKIRVPEEMKEYGMNLVRATDPKIADNTFDLKGSVVMGAGVRSSIALRKVARVFAFMDGRDYVNADDIKRAAIPVLRHRLKMSAAARTAGIKPEDIIEEILRAVKPYPKAAR